MTQEEKAKAYDEAIERAKEWYSDTQIDGEFKANLEKFFPELKESEDERIRKAIIGFFELQDDNTTYFFIPKKDILTWLEKQGEEPNWCHHKVDLSNCSEEYRKAYYDGWNNCNMQYSQCKSDGNDVVKCLINGMKFYYEGNEEATWGTQKFSMKVKDILSWLANQGKQKTIEEVNGEDYGIDGLWHAQRILEKTLGSVNGYQSDDGILDHKAAITAVKKLYEQKPVDKVEPIFNVGDWVVNNCGYVWKIEGILNQFYLLEGVEGGESRPTINWVDKTFHLWTIQDAKPGDVLFHSDSASNGIFIFKEILQRRTLQKVICYCDYDSEDGFCLGENHTCCWTDDKILHPATKEQCDLLFTKMKEAGYEWDVNKKELKKEEIK